MARRATWAAWVGVCVAAWGAGGGRSLAGEPPASAVCRLTIPKLVAARWDAEVILYHRDGAFHHGYARLPGRDNLPHRVDVTPSPPVRFETADGKAFDVPEKLRGTYSYKHPKFKVYREQYARGQLRVAHPEPVARIARGADGGVRGTVDVLVLGLDVANTPGRNNHSLVFRIEVDAAADGDRLAGTFVAWNYEHRDFDYGAESPRIRGRITGRWDRAFWRPAEGTEYAPGRDWPQVRGPAINGSAADCDRPFVDHLHDARLLWVADEMIGGGRSGGLTRGEFAMFPIAWTNTGYGGYAGPAVAGGRVYLHLMEPDAARIAADPTVANNIYVRLGADPRALANRLGHLRDAVICWDARTGRTLWHWRSEGVFGKVPESKAGRGTTACVAGGRVFARGHGGLYALDAATGELLWHKAGKDKLKYSSGTNSGFKSTWSHEKSPGMIGNRLVFACAGTLVGVDPDDGRFLWAVPKAVGGGAVPTRTVLDGRELIVTASELYEPSAKDAQRGAAPCPERLLLIDPADGKVLWTSDALGSNSLAVCVGGDVVVGNGVRGATGQKASRSWRAAGARVGRDGARRLWLAEDTHYPPHRATPVVHRGHALIDSRISGFRALELATGKVVGRAPHIYALTGGSHNWTWHLAGNGRVITSGLLLFDAPPAAFRPLPGRLSLDVASGYMCPIKPALADGRLFVRCSDKLVCYDLRKPPEAAEGGVVELGCPGAIAGAGGGGEVALRLRVRDGRPVELAASWPTLAGPERAVVASWAGVDTRHRWRATIPRGLSLDAAGLRGEAVVRIGHHYEPWTLALRREGGRLVGECIRRALPLAEPVAVEGTVAGDVRDLPDGERLWRVHLKDAAGGRSLRQGRPDADVTLAIVTRGADIRRAWAAAGAINVALHEVDPAGLEFADGRLAGSAVVLFHDDEYFDVHYESAAAECRPAGRGGLLAARYDLDARLADDSRLTGRHEGRVGVPWARSVAASGRQGGSR